VSQLQSLDEMRHPPLGERVSQFAHRQRANRAHDHQQHLLTCERRPNLMATTGSTGHPYLPHDAVLFAAWIRGAQGSFRGNLARSTGAVSTHTQYSFWPTPQLSHATVRALVSAYTSSTGPR
jgi:hypothetical protein